MKTNKRTTFCIFSYFILGVLSSFAQSKDLYTQENKFVKRYTTLSNGSGDAAQFGIDFKAFLSANPTTIDFPFNKLKNNSFYLTTSSDGNLRHYAWDTFQGGTMHFFDEIYQWKDGSKVSLKQSKSSAEGSSGEFSSKMYTINIQNKNHYLVVTNSIFSNRNSRQSVIAYVINNGKLVLAPIFKTKTQLLSRIDVDFDFFTVADRPERPLQLITFNDKQDMLLIPVVNENGKVTKRHIMYIFNGSVLEYKGIK